MKKLGKHYAQVLLAACLSVSGGMTVFAQEEAKKIAPIVGDKVKVENLQVIHRENRLVVDMDLNLDSLDLCPNRRLVFHVLVTDGENRRAMPLVVVNGRKQQIMYDRQDYKDFDENTTVVRRDNNSDQTVHYSAVLPGESWMRNADVVVEEDLCGCGEVLGSATSIIKRMRTPFFAYIRPAVEGKKTRYVEGRAYLDFPVDKITLYPEYRNNPRELEKIVNTINVVKEDKNTSITGITIHGYASPEDTYEHNTYLAENRAKTLKDYVRGLVELPDTLFSVGYTPEDWEGLRAYVDTADGLTHKEEILALIDDEEMNIDTKERSIRARYPEDYRVLLAECYPGLRHSDYTVNYVVRAFTVEEAKALLYTKPQQLSLEEMYQVAQTYDAGTPEFNEVFEIAVRMFPSDTTANLNAAVSQLQMGNLNAASRYLAKAGEGAEATHARGVLAMLRGENEKARACFERAAAAGLPEAEENLKLLNTDSLMTTEESTGGEKEKK